MTRRDVTQTLKNQTTFTPTSVKIFLIALACNSRFAPRRTFNSNPVSLARETDKAKKLIVLFLTLNVHLHHWNDWNRKTWRLDWPQGVIETIHTNLLKIFNLQKQTKRGYSPFCHSLDPLASDGQEQNCPSCAPR